MPLNKIKILTKDIIDLKNRPPAKNRIEAYDKWDKNSYIDNLLNWWCHRKPRKCSK